MARPEQSGQDIIELLTRGCAPALSPQELEATRAAIGEILAGKTPRSVNLAQLQRDDAMRRQQEEIARIERNHWRITSKIILALRKDLYAIPQFHDDVFSVGGVIPVAEQNWKTAVNVEPVFSRFSNGKSAMGCPSEAGGHWGRGIVEYGGGAAIMGFTANSRSALLSYISPHPVGAVTGTRAPTDMQYFTPVFALPNMRAEYERKRQFRHDLRSMIEQIGRGEGPQTVQVRNRNVHVGDFVEFMSKEGTFNEVYVMNLEGIAPMEQHTEYDRFEVHPSPEGVITPADIIAEGERTIWKQGESLSFQEVAPWQTYRIPKIGTARILGFTEDKLRALVEYRGCHFPDEVQRDKSLRGMQFFLSVIEHSPHKEQGEWHEILYGSSRLPPRGDAYFPLRMSSLEWSNIYTHWEVNEEFR